MGRTRILPRGSFKAKGADGKEVRITVSQEMVEGSDASGADMQAGDFIFRTSDGKHVNRIDKGIYQIVQPGMPEVRSDEPNAI